jgi:hypothetical protein
MCCLSRHLQRFFVFRRLVPYLAVVFLLTGTASIGLTGIQPFSSNHTVWLVLLPVLTGFLPAVSLFIVCAYFARRFVVSALQMSDVVALSHQSSLLTCRENEGVPRELHVRLLISILAVLRAPENLHLDRKTRDALAGEALFICSRQTAVSGVEIEFCREVFPLLPTWGVSHLLASFSRLTRRKPDNNAQQQISEMLHALLIQWTSQQSPDAGKRELLRPSAYSAESAP